MPKDIFELSRPGRTGYRFASGPIEDPVDVPDDYLRGDLRRRRNDCPRPTAVAERHLRCGSGHPRGLLPGQRHAALPSRDDRQLLGPDDTRQTGLLRQRLTAKKSGAESLTTRR